MKKAFNIFSVLLFLYLQQFQLSYSVTVGLKNNLTMALPWTLINMLIVSVPFLIELLIIKRIKWALLCNIIVISILSLISYHVLIFHGSPFFAWDVYSIPTAINVASEYSFVFDSISQRLIILFGLQIIIWLFIYAIIKKYNYIFSVKRISVAFCLILNSVILYIIFLSPFTIFEKGLMPFSWGTAVNKYGYGICFGNSIYVMLDMYSEPEGYAADKIMCSDSDEMSFVSEKKYPDIILILNETLADLNVYLDLDENEQIFSKLQNIDGIISGYTVSTLIGGGTNNSEYELLTSNSMQILNISAPFVSLDLTGSNSAVSYLKRLGYTTVGMHCCDPTNYNRNNAYPALGFDKSLLGKDNFNYYSENGSRPWTDKDNYQDMIEIYESCAEIPRFMYLLTYQNHGGYEQNISDDDTIKIIKNYGDYTDDINEYLSSVDKSADAFIALTEYYQDSDRDVVIMMLGDHMPAFVGNLACDKQLTQEQQEIAKRSVPYYVWSNREIDKSVFREYVSMVDLFPLLIKALDMPMTGYYKTIVDLNKYVPLRTYTGYYIDTNGDIGKINTKYSFYDKIQNYYYMEYNNLAKANDYNHNWFDLTDDNH